jgi:MYXO-CTERM domain-containing protein
LFLRDHETVDVGYPIRTMERTAMSGSYALARLLSQTRRLLTAMSLVVVAVLVHAQSAAAQSVYEDGAFDLDDWTVHGPFVVPEGDPGGGVDASAPMGGGNPEAHLRFQLTGVSVPLGNSSVVWGILINDQAVYDPGDGALGAIERVDFDFDGRLPAEGRGNRAVTLALQQDGFLWAAIDTRLFVDEHSWQPRSISALEESDFTAPIWAEDGQPPNPDFSEGASPIAFGVAQGSSCPVTSDCTAPPIPVELDIDNWAVTVNQTGLTIELSLDQVAGEGDLPELPFEFRVSAKVRNAGPSEVSEVRVLFLLPQEALAGFVIPGVGDDPECTPDSEVGFTTADCKVAGSIGPGASDTVRSPTGALSEPPAHIAVGYANVVHGQDDTIYSEFVYEASIKSFSGGQPDPADKLTDEFVLAVCNPTGMNPITVNDRASCDEIAAGGTPGTGGSPGAGGMGGSPGMDSGGGGCTAAPGPNPSGHWMLLLGVVGFALWHRRTRR